MRGSSNTIKCGHCHRTIEYLHARISNATGSLVCLNCGQVPSVPEGPIDPTYGIPLEEFTPTYAIPKHSRPNSKTNFSNQRVGQVFNHQIMSKTSPLHYKQSSPPLPNLMEIIRIEKILSPLLQTPPHSSPIHRNSPIKVLQETIEVIPIDEALAQFDLIGIEPALRKETTNEFIDIDVLVNNKLQRVGLYSTPQQRYRPKSISPRVTYQSPTRSKSPLPSTSSGITGLNANTLRLSPEHNNSDSDIDDPAPMESPTTLRGYLTDFHEYDNKNCKSSTHHPMKKKVLKTKAERTKTIRKNILDFECTVQGCDQSFRFRKSLWRHLDIVHNRIKLFKCDICDRAFTYSGDLTRHKRAHTGEKPYACDICGKAFTQSSDLTVHKRTHTGEKPYSCDICGNAFTHSGDLTRHKRIHTGEKPHICTICGKALGRNSDLTKHKRSQHHQYLKDLDAKFYTPLP